MSETLKVTLESPTGRSRSSGRTGTSTPAVGRSPEQAYTLLGEGTVRLLLDLEKTKIVNSIGISILIEVLEVLDQGRLAFCRLTPTVEDVPDHGARAVRRSSTRAGGRPGVAAR